MAFDRDALQEKRLQNAEQKLAAILAMIHAELAGYPGDDAMRVLRKLLDIIDD